MRTRTTLVSVSVSAAAVDENLENPEIVLAATMLNAINTWTSNPVRVKVFVRAGNGDASREFTLETKGA